MATGSTLLLFFLLAHGCVSSDPPLYEPTRSLAHYSGEEPPVLLAGSGAGYDADRSKHK